ncbi:MAG TPA: GAF domain-containing protein [Longimicrobium sp.]|nr:GAF domain-containing protein [Longimicrobium sp.]
MTDERGTAAAVDRERLAEIAALDLMSAETDAVLQETAEEAAARLGLPISLVTVVLDQAQYFAAQHGLEGWMREARGTPVEWSFCVNAVKSGEPFVVEDATRHPLVRGNPLVSEDGIRCYAGIPLVTSRGHTLGTLCVIGKEARTFTGDELAMLRELAAKAVARIESRRKA